MNENEPNGQTTTAKKRREIGTRIKRKKKQLCY